MPKPVPRISSHYAREAAELLGLLIRSARVERGMTAADLAERAGVSRGLVHRVENGDLGCSIGAAFEMAAIVGVRLFEAEPATLTRHLALAREKLALLPRAARQGGKAVKDDF